MVIEIIDLKYIAFNKSKNYPPIGSNRDCPEAIKFTLQRVRFESWKIHILNRTGSIQACEDITQLGQMFRHYASRVIVFIEAFQPLVAEGMNHNPA